MLSLNTASVSSCSTSNSIGIDDPWKDHPFFVHPSFLRWLQWLWCVVSMMIFMIKMMMMNVLAIMILLIGTIMTMMMMMMMMMWRWGVQVDILQLPADGVVTASSLKKYCTTKKGTSCDLLYRFCQIKDKISSKIVCAYNLKQIDFCWCWNSDLHFNAKK